MATPTNWPYRQALTVCLKQILLDVAVPAINAAFAERMTAANASQIVQFSDATVLLDDPDYVSEPVICLVDGAEDVALIGSGTFNLSLVTQIQVKTPWAGDDTPEDFFLFGAVVQDALRDLLTSQANWVIPAKNPQGQNLLPGGQAFTNCYYRGSRKTNFPNRTSAGTIRCHGWTIMHYAEATMALSRPNALGS